MTGPLQVTKPDLTTEASVIWDLVAAPLIADGRLVAGDELFFAEYCELQAMADRAQAQVHAEGMMVGGGGTGSKLQKNPAFNVWRDASRAARDVAVQFGIGPKSRKQLGIKQTGASGSAKLLASLGER